MLPKSWCTSTFSLKCFVSGRGNTYLADRRHSAVWWRNPCVLVVHKYQIQQQNLQTAQNKNASTMTTCHKNTKFTSQSAFAAFFSLVFVLTLSAQLVRFFFLKSRVCLFSCWEKLLMYTDDVSGSFSFFFKEWMCAERSHPSLHSFIYCHCLLWASRWDSNKGMAGWINYYDDEPHRQSSLNPIGLSAVCCSFQRRHYGIAASLWRALRESVCVCGWGKWYRQAIDFTFCNWSFRNTKRKVAKMLKCFYSALNGYRHVSFFYLF